MAENWGMLENHFVQARIVNRRKIFRKCGTIRMRELSIWGIYRKKWNNIWTSNDFIMMLSYRFWELSEGCDGRIVNLRNLQNKVKQHMNQQWFHIDIVFFRYWEWSEDCDDNHEEIKWKCWSSVKIIWVELALCWAKMYSIRKGISEDEMEAWINYENILD